MSKLELRRKAEHQVKESIAYNVQTRSCTHCEEHTRYAQALLAKKLLCLPPENSVHQEESHHSKKICISHRRQLGLRTNQLQ